MSSVQRAVLAAAGVGLIGLGAVFSQNGSTEPRPVVARDDKPAETIGMAGCAATGCHGRTNVRHGTLDADTWHESFALWLDRDPHTRSYAVLSGTLAKQMMKRLHQGDPSIPEDATRDLRCLACHTNPSLAKPIDDASGQLQRIRAEGVSCEACHGNAEHWQIAHTNPIPPNQRKDILDKWQMNDLNDWNVQAATCTGCHIGAPEDTKRGIPVRDMNHDMIAAGHPRLEFDFTSYQAKLAKHWLPRDRSTGQKHADDAMLLAWVNGQLAVEAAYCNLSLDRMARGNATDRSPYPEFADWNCSHCHHQLAGAAWREEAAKKQSGSRGLGRPGWIGASAFLPASTAPTFGEGREVQKTKLAERLDRIAARSKTLKNAADARRMVGELLAKPSVVPANWEEATRDYLGLRSLEAVLREAGGTPANETLARLADARKAFWGSPDEPGRKEHSAKDYHRKPESRWLWEQNVERRNGHPIDATLRALRESLAKDLQQLPAANPKP